MTKQQVYNLLKGKISLKKSYTPMDLARLKVIKTTRGNYAHHGHIRKLVKLGLLRGTVYTSPVNPRYKNFLIKGEDVVEYLAQTELF